MFNVIVVWITLILTAWVSVGAHYSIPWEPLYWVKIYFNESLISSLALTHESEAKLQLELIENRIQELNELKYENISDEIWIHMIENNIVNHIKIFLESYWQMPYKNPQKEILKNKFNLLIGNIWFELDTFMIQ